MSKKAAPPADGEHHVRMRQWIEKWAQAGPLLDAERWKRLASMTDDDAQQESRRVLELWQPEWPTDDGDELLRHQRVFGRARARE